MCISHTKTQTQAKFLRGSCTRSCTLEKIKKTHKKRRLNIGSLCHWKLLRGNCTRRQSTASQPAYLHSAIARSDKCNEDCTNATKITQIQCRSHKCNEDHTNATKIAQMQRRSYKYGSQNKHKYNLLQVGGSDYASENQQSPNM